MLLDLDIDLGLPSTRFVIVISETMERGITVELQDWLFQFRTNVPIFSLDLYKLDTFLILYSIYTKKQNNNK